MDTLGLQRVTGMVGKDGQLDRGQLVVCLRLLHVPVHSVDGPTVENPSGAAA